MCQLMTLFFEINMEINRKQILETVLEIIRDISDKDYQRRVWIREEGPEVDDFIETVCVFSSQGDGVIKEFKEFGLTDSQCQIFKRFRDHFHAFAADNDWPHLFIDTPEWTKITEEAKEVLKAFNHLH